MQKWLMIRGGSSCMKMKEFLRKAISICLGVCIIFSTFPDYYVKAVETSDLLAHYDFSGLSGAVLEGTSIQDKSGNNNNATAYGTGLTCSEGALTLPGGAYGSGAGYVELPKGMFDNQNSLTLSMRLKNETGSGYYCAFFFGNEAGNQYFMLNPKTNSGTLKAVITNAVSSTPYTTEVGSGTTSNLSDGPATDDAWTQYTVVISPGSLTAYVNGVKYKTYTTNRNVSDFGSNLISYIGKSTYQDIFYKGSIKDVQIYKTAFSDTEVNNLYLSDMTVNEILNNAADSLSIPEVEEGYLTSKYNKQLTLADNLMSGVVDVSWSSSNPTIITKEGVVTSPSEDTKVKLTATLTKDGVELQKVFDVLVIPEEEATYSMVVDSKKTGVDISQELFGLFFEDINSAADGGLYPEMVKNNSFENYFNVVSTEEKAPGNQYSWKLHWVSDNANNFVVEQTNGLNEKNTNNAKITGNMTLKNGGFAPMSAPNSAAMPIKKDHEFDLSMWVKADSSYSGIVKAKLVNESGVALSEEKEISLIKNGEWQKVSSTLMANDTQKGKLVLTVTGADTTDVLYLDMVSLIPQDSYGYGNKNYAYGSGVRKDLVEKLDALNPGFIRFPGGCIIEGNSGRHSYYNWENSVGALEERKATGNLWASDNGSYTNTYGYMMSYGFGYHEILTLCEDLGAEPFPILSAGVFCQFANSDQAPAASGAELEKFAQHATHLVDYCWGSVSSTNSTQREWAEKRVQNGHETPFNLNYIGIGNENWMAKYFNNFDYIKNYVEDYVKVNYPDRKITIISSAGPSATGEKIDYAWSWLNSNAPGETLVDEHYYVSKDFMLNNDNRYDSYKRLEEGGSNVFVGEYATHMGTKNNCLESAICDAAYMTGFERNGDIVRHSSYAPLFEKIGGTNWNQNMIHFDEYESFATPNYYTQQMFGQNYGKTIVETSLQKKGTDWGSNSGSPILGTWSTAGYITHVKVTREDGKVLLDDDFSTNGAGGMTWEKVTGSSGTFTIADGKLTLSQGSGLNAVWLPEAMNNPEWYDYKVDATVVKTAGAEGFLVGAGAKDQNTYTWYNIGGWDNTKNVIEIKKASGNSTIQSTAAYQPVALNTPMNVTFSYGIQNKLVGGYTTATFDNSSEITSNYKSYQNDIYQVSSKDEEYIYLKLVNHDDFQKDISLSYPGLKENAQAEIICMTGDPGATNSIGNEVVKPVTTYETIQNQKLSYLIPAMSFTVIKVKYSENIIVESISLDKVNETIGVGESVTLKATVLPSNATNSAVSWESSNPEIATVQDGIITAKTVGTATITAKAGSKSATCTITVKASLSEIVSLESAIVTTLAGKSPVLPEMVVATYTDGSKKQVKVTWNSINASSYGTVGKFTVEGTVIGTTLKASCNVIVSVVSKDISGITVTGLGTFHYTGKAITPHPLVMDGNTILKEGTDYTLSYSNNINVGIAKVILKGSGIYTGTVTKDYRIALYKGKTYTVGSYRYKVIKTGMDGKGTVSLTGATKKGATAVTIRTTVTIGGVKYSITAVADKAFKGYKKLKSVTIGSNISNIGKNAFYGCGVLKKLTVKSLKIVKVGSNAFKGINAKAVMKVPSKKYNSYKKLFGNKGQKRTVKLKKS